MATLGNKYFLRSFLLLVEGGSYIVRTIIKRECQKKGGNLDKLLQEFEKKLKHEFHGKQYQKLFPESGCTDISKWDLQLLIGVVTIVFRTSLLKHEKKELVVLKQLRNEVYMHCSSASLDDDKYEEIKEQLDDSITILASTFEDSVQECCSKYIKQFISGPLDAVRPSIATLYEVSQTCLKKVNVGMHTELAVVGPSDYWTGLLEQTLDTVFNSAITGSEGDEFEEIKNEVNKMLEFLLANKDVVLKDCTKALYSFERIDDEEINESRLEISSEMKTDDTGEDKTQQGADEIKTDDTDEDQTEQGADDTACLTTESAQPLLLNLECTSKEGLLHILNAFKGDELQLHMKSIADALSAHFNQKVSLKTSLNLKEFMEAFEETAIADSSVDRVLIENVSEAEYSHLELDAEVQEIESPRKETLLGTSVKAVSEDSVGVRTVDDYYIFFRGINPDTKKETLASFIEVTTNGAVLRDKIILSYTKTSALVTVSLDQNPDLRSVEDKIQKMGIDGEKPDVYEVPPPESIAVSSEEDIINMECLVFYFESRKIGGVEIKQDPYKSEDGSCIVIQFGDPDIVQRICTKDTTYLWEGKRLRVSPFFKCKAGEIWDSEIHTLRIPEPVLVKFQPNILVLLQREWCGELLTELKTNHCVPTFSEQGLELECTLTSTLTGFKRLAKDWEKSSKHIVDSYISNNILEKSFESSANVWTELMKYFKSENLHECEELVTSVDDSNFVILLTGLRNTVEQLLLKLEAKKTEIEKRLGRQTENIVFDAPRLQLLRSTGVFEEVKLEMMDIQLHIGEDEVAIEGQSKDIDVVKLKLYEINKTEFELYTQQKQVKPSSLDHLTSFDLELESAVEDDDLLQILLDDEPEQENGRSKECGAGVAHASSGTPRWDLDNICMRLGMSSEKIILAFAAVRHYHEKTPVLVCLTKTKCTEVPEEFEGFRVLQKPFYPSSKESLRAENSVDISFRGKKYNRLFKNIKHINETIAFHADKLFRKHTNLEAIRLSVVHATRHGFRKRPCIVLVCRCKSYIPFGESEFPTELRHPNKYFTFKTDVREGYFILCVNGHAITRYSNEWNKELAMGCSIGPENDKYSATIGPFVSIEETNETCFLTVRHVFQPLDQPSDQIVGTNVVQPAGGDLPRQIQMPNRRCGTVKVAEMNEKIDAALVSICPERIPSRGNFVDVRSDDLDFAGFTERQYPIYDDGSTHNAMEFTADDFLFDRIIKFGKESGLRKGTLRISNMAVKVVTGIGSIQHDGRPQTRTLTGQLQVDSYAGKTFCQEGDSGSAVFHVDKKNKLHCIGIVTGIMSDLTCVVTPIQPILAGLGEKINKTLKLKSFDFKEMEICQ